MWTEIPGKIGDFSIVAEDIPEDVSQMMWARHRKRTFYLVRDCRSMPKTSRRTRKISFGTRILRTGLYQCNLRGDYPKLGENVTCVGVIDNSTGAIVTVLEDGRAVYRITLQVEYVERIF